MNDAKRIFADAMNETKQQALRQRLVEAVRLCEAHRDNQEFDLIHLGSQGLKGEVIVAKMALHRMERMLEAVKEAQEAAK